MTIRQGSKKGGKMHALNTLGIVQALDLDYSTWILEFDLKERKGAIGLGVVGSNAVLGSGDARVEGEPRVARYLSQGRIRKAVAELVEAGEIRELAPNYNLARVSDREADMILQQAFYRRVEWV